MGNDEDQMSVSGRWPAIGKIPRPGLLVYYTYHNAMGELEAKGIKPGF